jgi:hypothetical protein
MKFYLKCCILQVIKVECVHKGWDKTSLWPQEKETLATTELPFSLSLSLHSPMANGRNIEPVDIGWYDSHHNHTMQYQLLGFNMWLTFQESRRSARLGILRAAKTIGAFSDWLPHTAFCYGIPDCSYLGIKGRVNAQRLQRMGTHLCWLSWILQWLHLQVTLRN